MKSQNTIAIFFFSIYINRERIYSDSFTKENQKKFRVLDWLRD